MVSWRVREEVFIARLRAASDRIPPRMPRSGMGTVPARRTGPEVQAPPSGVVEGGARSEDGEDVHVQAL